MTRQLRRSCCVLHRLQSRFSQRPVKLLTPASCPHGPQRVLKIRKSDRSPLRKVLNAINSHSQDSVINSPFSPYWVDTRQPDRDTHCGYIRSVGSFPDGCDSRGGWARTSTAALQRNTATNLAAGSTTTFKCCAFTRKVRGITKNQITGKKIPKNKPNPKTNTNPKHQEKGLFFAEGILSEVSK